MREGIVIKEAHRNAIPEAGDIGGVAIMVRTTDLRYGRNHRQDLYMAMALALSRVSFPFLTTLHSISIA